MDKCHLFRLLLQFEIFCLYHMKRTQNQCRWFSTAILIWLLCSCDYMAGKSTDLTRKIKLINLNKQHFIFSENIDGYMYSTVHQPSRSYVM